MRCGDIWEYSVAGSRSSSCFILASVRCLNCGRLVSRNGSVPELFYFWPILGEAEDRGIRLELD